MSPQQAKDFLARARGLPTSYQVAVGLANIAERMHHTCKGSALSILGEAIEQVQSIDPPVSRAYALRTIFNYVKPIGTEATRPILTELASLQSDHEESPIAATLIGALVSSRIDTDFVDDLANRMQPDARSAMATHSIAIARNNDRGLRPPKQPGSIQDDYRCKTINGKCTLIYQAAQGRGRRWQHNWILKWCKSASQCGVQELGKTNWTKCEHPDSHMQAVTGLNHHPANSRHN